jgi:hypothetical protein
MQRARPRQYFFVEELEKVFEAILDEKEKKKKKSEITSEKVKPNS